MKEHVVIISNSATHVLVNEYPNYFKMVTKRFPPHVYADDYEKINEISGKRLVHALLFEDPIDAYHCTNLMNEFSKDLVGCMSAVYGPDFTDEDIEVCRNGERLFEELPSIKVKKLLNN